MNFGSLNAIWERSLRNQFIGLVLTRRFLSSTKYRPCGSIESKPSPEKERKELKREKQDDIFAPKY